MASGYIDLPLEKVSVADELVVGDAGTEGSGIDISGVTYESTFKVSDIDGTNYAQTILHRHSTTLEPLIIGARSNSNTSAHADVVAGQGVFSIYGAGHVGADYKLFNSIVMKTSALGTISSTSAPGSIVFNTTPNSAVVPTAHLTLDSDKSSSFAGKVIVTSNSNESFEVGPNGTTNPVFQVDSSTASQATGIKITGAAAAGGAKIEAISSATNEDLALGSKAAGSVKVQVAGLNKYIASQYAHTFTSTAYLGANTVRFGVTGSSDLTLTASVEAPNAYFNYGQTRQHATGALTLQRDFRISPSTHSFVGASTLTNAAAFSVDGPATGGTNATITNSSAIHVPTSAVTSVTNSYGISVAATTGATNNYAASFTGGSVGVGTASPASFLHSFESNAGTGNSNGITIEQGSTGDAVQHFLLSGSQRYTMGIDNSDGDKFKLGSTADLGTTNFLTITTAGQLGVGTTSPNTSTVKAFNRVVDIGSTTDLDLVGLSLKVIDGVNNRRVGFFLDDNTGEYGFDATASSGTPNFVIQSAGAEKVRVTSAGNVGVGITVPTSKLDVATDGSSSTIAVTGYGTSSAGFFNGRAARGTLAAPTASQAFDNLGGLNVGGYGATAFGGSRLSIRGFAAENWTDAAQGAYWSFLTTPNGTASAVEVMRLNSSGNLGLGTTNPLVRLDVVATAANQFRLADTTTDATAKLSYVAGRHYTNAQADVLHILGNSAVSSTTMSYGGGSGSMNSVTEHRFYTGATNTTLTGTQRMTIASNGNVGIGVTSPNANAILDVTSTTKAFMPPRMTTAQKDAIASPTAGMMVYDSTLNKLCVYTTAWETITSV